MTSKFMDLTTAGRRELFAGMTPEQQLAYIDGLTTRERRHYERLFQAALRGTWKMKPVDLRVRLEAAGCPVNPDTDKMVRLGRVLSRLGYRLVRDARTLSDDARQILRARARALNQKYGELHVARYGC